MDYEMIVVEKLGSIGRITLNRPERLNAFNVQMGLELLDAIRDFEGDENIRVIVFGGAGRSFCAGDDLSGMATPGYERDNQTDPVKSYVFGRGRFTHVVHAIRRCPKPVVCMLRGHAYGAGLNLALACDMRVVSETALLATPFIKRAMGTGVNLLHYYVGLGVMTEMAFLGEPLDAAKMERHGIANRVVADDKLEESTMELAARLADGPTISIGLTKAAIRKGWFQDVDVAYDYQGYAQHLANQTEDRAEGGKAFSEKRLPNFVGR
jgi:2-(1,2-epoxy-1,2-dihydrophenyl)acetyl-CoA isomerase